MRVSDTVTYNGHPTTEISLTVYSVKHLLSIKKGDKLKLYSSVQALRIESHVLSLYLVGNGSKVWKKDGAVLQEAEQESLTVLEKSTVTQVH